MNIKSILLFLACISVLSCSFKEEVFIVTGNNEAMVEAGTELADYLSGMYPQKNIITIEKEVKQSQNIILEINDVELTVGDSYIIGGNSETLFIKGNNLPGVYYGIYGLLRELGWDFFLSFEIEPKDIKPLDFSRIKAENTPLTQKRILFNWHNFVSGCTGWDFRHWEEWIDNGLKAGYNTIMVHAYGNNPMHSFSHNGKEKEIGYLTTTLKGRDWGAQHVNDVRLLTGGEIFEEYEFGSEAAKVPEEERVEAATALMQKVFRHAGRKGMGISFALDIDTWMANPQEIISTLPQEAIITVANFKTVNPEHPEGRRFYKAQLEKLFSDYPEITMLAAWIRRPRQNMERYSIILNRTSSTLPKSWQTEFFAIRDSNPEIKDELPYPGLFAISKIIKVYREILDEIKPEVELVLGSWALDYPKQSELFIPEYCGFIPLDFETKFDDQEKLEELGEVGKNRNMYPIVWAHHDDHRYIGRPYRPYEPFNDMLNQANANGFGVIHWTTYPLDLLFKNYNDQVWSASENIEYDNTVKNFAQTLLKSKDDNFINYLKLWHENAPMFGRETTNFFMQLRLGDYMLDGYSSSEEVIEKSQQRLELLNLVNKDNLTISGLKEFNYYIIKEKFIISFFTNHHYAHQAFTMINDGNLEGARPLVENFNPLETIRLYAETLTQREQTRGEEGMLISLNLRWLPDFIDLEQRLGIEPVYLNFQPTSHDPLAQHPGTHTFFIDNDGQTWHALGEKELGIPAGKTAKLPLIEVKDSWLNISESASFSVQTIRRNDLPSSEYHVKFIFAPESSACQIRIVESDEVLSSVLVEEGSGEAVSNITTKGNTLSIQVNAKNGIVKLSGIILNPIAK